MSGIPWSDVYRRRKEAHDRFPSLFRLPTVRRAARLARARVRAGARILEVGAGDRRRGAALAREVPDAVSVSVDPDPSGGHDHAAIDEVKGLYDLALALEVIEHMPHEEGIALLSGIRERLTRGGIVVVSTPNVFCPGRFLRDATHVTPYAWDELGGALLLAGFDLVGLYRVAPGSVLRRVSRALASPLARAVGIDLAPSIAAVGKA